MSGSVTKTKRALVDLCHSWADAKKRNQVLADMGYSWKPVLQTPRHNIGAVGSVLNRLVVKDTGALVDEDAAERIVSDATAQVKGARYLQAGMYELKKV